MLRLSLYAISSAVLASCATSTAPAPEAQGWTYPASKTVTQVDTYHGVEIQDPYRWLEELDAPDTRAWIEAQNQLSGEYLAKIPARDAIRARLTELWNYERYGLPNKEGGKYFITRNDGLQNQSVLYVMDRLDGEARVLLDPNTLSSDGTVALSGTAVSPDGKYLAYGTSSGGSDWQEWRVRDIATGQDLPDKLSWVKFSGAAWNKDGSGFYYSRYDEPTGENKLKALNENQQVWFHRVGTAQSEDVLVYRRPDQPKWGFGADVSDDGRYLTLNVWQGTDERNRFFYKDLSTPDAPVVELIAELEAAFNFVGNDGTRFYFHTNLQAPRYRLIAIDIARPERANWQEVIAESDATLQQVEWVGGQFVAEYLRDARSEVRRFGRDGKTLGDIALPGLGTASGFSGKPEDQETFYSFTSFTVPTDIYRYDFSTGQSTLFRRPTVAFDGSQYETTQVFYTSADGTRVPMFITARKGTPRDASQPTLLYAYGGFNIPVTPSYSVPVATWLDRGGIYAVANIRGGGEYGQAWHQAAVKTQRQKAFDDFIAAAEFLIAERYTSAEHLAIHGRSNGGLLTAAVLLQRPELYAAAVPGVGVLDMLRFNRFTIGWAWESDYGSPQNPAEFQALRAYSPLHNVKPGVEYPATLITTGDHDDRVYPAHSFKFTAALQAAAATGGPILTRIETRGGHGAGKPTSMQIDEWTDVLSFLGKHTGTAP